MGDDLTQFVRLYRTRLYRALIHEGERQLAKVELDRAYVVAADALRTSAELLLLADQVLPGGAVHERSEG